MFQSSEYFTVDRDCSECRVPSSESFANVTSEYLLRWEAPSSCDGWKLVKNGSRSCSWELPTAEIESALRCGACLRGLPWVIAVATDVLLVGESSFDCERRPYSDVCEASTEGDIVDLVCVRGGDVVVGARGVTDAFDLVDLVERLGGEISSIVDDAEVFALDLVFLAGPAAGTAMVCNSPILWPSSGTSMNISPDSSARFASFSCCPSWVPSSPT
jgi:hypothetical protein